MKKFLALVLAFALVFCLVACGKQGDEDGKRVIPGTEIVLPADRDEADKADKADEADTADEADKADKDEASDKTKKESKLPEEITEEVDFSDFSFGVTEEKDNLVVTVKNETELGEVTCVMTYVYKEDKLESALLKYYAPDKETAKALAEEMKGDETVVSSSIKVDGVCVSCEIADDQLEALRQLSREELTQTLKATIGEAQAQ